MPNQGWPEPLLRPADEPLVLEVECRTGRRARGRTHPVTLTRDWVLDTGHDLELERIGAAMGGYLSCLELADTVVPATRDLWLHRARHVPAAIAHDDERAWSVRDALRSCECDHYRWPEAGLAVAHLESAVHWAWAHAASIVAVQSFFADVARAVPDSPLAMSPTQARLAAPLVLEPDGVHRLWRLGIPPAVVCHIHDQIGADGPLPVRCYREIVLRDTDPAWLREFIAFDVPAITWAATAWGDQDLADASARAGWLAAGAHPHDVSDVLGGPHSLADITELARRTATDVRRAAAAVAAWARVGCEPGLVDLEFLLRRDPATRPGFGRSAVEVLVHRFSRMDPAPTPTQAGLVLGLAGAVPIADSLLRMGVRSLSAADAIL